MKIKFISILFCFLFCNSIFAQLKKTNDNSGSSSDISKFLEDGKKGISNNIIRLRLGRAIAGHVGLSYERRFTKRFGLEAGGYYKAYTLFGYEIEDQYFSFGPGAMVLINPKYYISGISINRGYYMGLNYRFATGKTLSNISGHDVSNSNYNSHAFSLNIGSHRQIGGAFTYGFDWGAGIYSTQYKNVKFNTISPFNPINNPILGTSNFFIHGDFNFGILF